MEQCLRKPDVRKNPKPPKPPPKPKYEGMDATLSPGSSSSQELSKTQQLIRRIEMGQNEGNGNLIKPENKGRPVGSKMAPPRMAEKESKVTRQSDEAPKDDSKQTGQRSLSGKFQKSQKEKSPTFTSYVAKEGEKEDLMEVNHAVKSPAGKQTSKDPSQERSAEESIPEKERSPESKHKHVKGGLLAGIFRKTPKERVPSLTVSAADIDPDIEENASCSSREKGGLFSHEDQEEPQDTPEYEKGGIYSGILRKSPKLTGADPPAQDKQSLPSELSASKDSLSEANNTTKEKGGFFSGMFKKHPPSSLESPQLDEDKHSLHSELSVSSDSLSENKEKGGLFTGLLKKAPKVQPDSQANLFGQKELSASNDSLSESKNNKEKGGLFGGIFRKSPKSADVTEPDEDKQSLNSDLLASNESLSETKGKDHQKELTASNDSLSDCNPAKEKSLFGGIFKKAQKPTEEGTTESEANLFGQKELSASNDSLSESKNNKEKGGLFGGIFRKSPKSADVTEPDEDKQSLNSDLLASNESLSETKGKDHQKELTASNDSLSDCNPAKEKSLFGGIFKKAQKHTEEGTTESEENLFGQKELSASNDSLSESKNNKEKKGGLTGLFKRSTSIENLFDNEEKSIFSGILKKKPKAAEGSTADEDLNPATERLLSASCDDLPEAASAKEKTGGLSAMFKRSPNPAPRSAVIKDPLSETKELSASCDSLTETLTSKDNPSKQEEMSASNDSLNESSATKEKKRGLGGMFRKTPKALEQQEGDDIKPPEGSSQLKRRRTITKKKRVVSFRVKRTLPKIPKSSDKLPVLEESVEMQDMKPVQETTVEIQPVEMAAFPNEENPDIEEENDDLMEWWNGVVGWAEWNETSNFQEDEEEIAVEQAADRVFMAARLFVHLFNQRGASLQKRILELLAQADAADQFHKRTVSAAVGGGVASVAGSVATITGLILAPFTFGASIIVTAVGIGVATAGSITSATANITDTVHSNMDRKKVEKMIQGYQEEIKDIQECLEFVQEGMNTLQEWDFEKYSESAAKKALNHNIKHVMKEGGRAGKALMINTDKLISTVQVLGAAGGAAKAAQAISVTTGVMSALFLALDVFFLAKDSHELRKGAKTKFAGKIREVCQDLQAGLLELNKVKSQLQKTMDGIELEEYVEILEVEEEVEEEVAEGDLESDPVKLAQLDQELDLLEEKLDRKVQEEQKGGIKVQEEKSRKDGGGKDGKNKGKEEANDKAEAGSGWKIQKEERKVEDEDENSNKKMKEVQEVSKKVQKTKTQLLQGEQEQRRSSHEEENAATLETSKELKRGKKEKEAENRTQKANHNQNKGAGVTCRSEGRKEEEEEQGKRTEAHGKGKGKRENDKDDGKSQHLARAERQRVKDKRIGASDSSSHHTVMTGSEEKEGTKCEAERHSSRHSSRSEREIARARNDEERGCAMDVRGETNKWRAGGGSGGGRDAQGRGDAQDDPPTSRQGRNEGERETPDWRAEAARVWKEGQSCVPSRGKDDKEGGEQEAGRRESDSSRKGVSPGSPQGRLATPRTRYSALELGAGGGGSGSQRERNSSEKQENKTGGNRGGVETGGGSRGARREDRESQRRDEKRGGDAREQEPRRSSSSRSSSRPNAVLADGLYI